MKKRKIITSILLTATLLASLCACGQKDNNSGKKVYKVGIVQYVDDASLNQIESAIEKELDAKGKENNVVFEYKKYMISAYKAKQEGYIATDDCMLAEYAGFKVKLVETGNDNIKITVQDDIKRAEAILNARGEQLKWE